MAKLVSKTYGEALFEAATEAGKTKQLMEELEVVQTVLAQNPDFDRLMKHPGIPKQEKIKVVEKAFQNRVSEELAGFLKIVVEKERYGELPAIFDYFTDRVKEAEKIGVAYVKTALELTEEQKEKVEQRLLETTGYLSMEMHFSTDASLIGGMVIRIKDRVVDSSIRTRLEDLKRQLLKIQLSGAGN